MRNYGEMLIALMILISLFLFVLAIVRGGR